VPLFLPGPFVPRLFHLAFNRLDTLNEQLVRGREDLFFGYIFDAEATIKLPDYAVSTTPTASPRAAPRSAAASGSTARGTPPPSRTGTERRPS
jgi:hypothetical protein